MKELNQSILNLWNLYEKNLMQEKYARCFIIQNAIGYLEALRDILYQTNEKHP